MKELIGFLLGVAATVVATWLYFVTIGHYATVALGTASILCVW